MFKQVLETLAWNFIAIVAKVLQGIAHIILYFIQIDKKKSIPPSNDPVLEMSAARLAEQIRQGKLRSEDVVQSFIARIREVNPIINAVAEERYEEALAEARSADLFVLSKVKTPQEIALEKPLLGVPVSIKMLLSVKGMACNGGSIVYKGVKAHEDAQVVSQMKNAGAICIVTTNTPEFGVYIETFNKVYGTTRNPHDTRRTPGGSSGGEAALISSAGSVLGVGNDLIGSLRFPAFCTGIFSHKPTNGIVSNRGTFPSANDEFMWYVSTGPMCRYADDLPVAMKVLLDPKFSHIKIEAPVDFSSTIVYYIEDEGGNPTVPAPDRDIIKALQKVVKHFSDRYGAKVEKVSLKSLRHCLQASLSKELGSLKKPLEEYFYGDQSRISPPLELLKNLFRLQSKTTFLSSLVMHMGNIPTFLLNEKQYQRQFQMMQDEVTSYLGTNSVLITPTFPKTAVYHYETLLLLLGSGYTSVCNLLGLPATQCPVGASTDGLPLGVQVIGAKEHDYLTIAFAKEIEKAFGGWVVPKSE